MSDKELRQAKFTMNHYWNKYTKWKREVERLEREGSDSLRAAMDAQARALDPAGGE